MFDMIGNLPLHPLAVHAVVVGAPLAVVLGFLFAVPRTRNWSRWVLALAGLGTAAAGYVAKESGEALKASLGIQPSTQYVGPLIAQHSMLADQLTLMLYGYAVLAVANALVVTRPGRAAAGGGPRAIDRVLPILLVLLGIVIAVWVYRVGDLGARAVWNPTGVAG